MSRHDATERRMIRRGGFCRQEAAAEAQLHVVVLMARERKMRPRPDRQHGREPRPEFLGRGRSGAAPPVKYRKNTGEWLYGGYRKHRERVTRGPVIRGSLEPHRRDLAFNPKRKIYIHIGEDSSPKCAQYV